MHSPFPEKTQKEFSHPYWDMKVEQWLKKLVLEFLPFRLKIKRSRFTLRNAENVNSVLPAKQTSVRRSVLPRVKVSCLMGLHVFLPAGNRCSIIWGPLRFRNTRCFLKLHWLRSAHKPPWKKSACWDAELRQESVQF